MLRMWVRLLVGDFVGEDRDFTEARSNSVETAAIDRSRYDLHIVCSFVWYLLGLL